MASCAKDIQFKELKDTTSQLNTTIHTQNDLILSLQKMLKNAMQRTMKKTRSFQICRHSLNISSRSFLAVPVNDAVT
jgi:hypothetical protein